MVALVLKEGGEEKKIELKEVGYFLAGAGKLYYIPPTYYLDTIVF